MPREVFTDALSSVCLFIFFICGFVYIIFRRSVNFRNVFIHAIRAYEFEQKFRRFFPEDDGDMKQKQILSCAVLIGRTSSVNIIRDPCVYLQFLG